ncbi:hypothetical protein ACN38_g6681 [Penicillium nordicum]|uniref:Uncharacterized protein n=1 Tax=Penicillium nordicum TaxID=229535 RepID=A0A0M9WF18_9EURO|nr:hypothetical protein ACN38_g6681 [Penicillium nordicum]
MGYDIRDRSPLPLDVTNASATSTSNVIGQLDKVLYVILEPNGSGSNKAVCSDGTYRLKLPSLPISSQFPSTDRSVSPAPSPAERLVPLLLCPLTNVGG